MIQSSIPSYPNIPPHTNTDCLSHEALLSLIDNNASVDDQNHLQNCPECQRSLQEADDELMSLRYRFQPDELEERATHQDNEFLELPVGEIVGKYELLELLNSGGQGLVYRAWDPQLNREVALKIGRRTVQDSREGRSRIQQEGVFLAQIEHPHLARVYDFGVHFAHPYLIMEYVHGMNLQQLIATRELKESEIRSLILQVSSALALCHERGILHLDLKPENIMISDGKHATLIDFGVSWILSQTGDPQNIVAGTLEFMSPEQYSGWTTQWSERTDIYGLGGLLFFLLTGSAPDVAEEEEHDLRKSLEDRLERSSYTKSLKNVCLKALAYLPEDRYQNVRSFQSALRTDTKWMGGLLITAGAILVILAICFWSQGRSWASTSLQKIPENPSRSGIPPVDFRIHVASDSPKPVHLFFWTSTRGPNALRLQAVGQDANRTDWQSTCRLNWKYIRPPDGLLIIIAFHSDQPARQVWNCVNHTFRHAETLKTECRVGDHVILSNNILQKNASPTGKSLKQIQDRMLSTGENFMVQIWRLPEDFQQSQLRTQEQLNFALTTDVPRSTPQSPEKQLSRWPDDERTVQTP